MASVWQGQRFPVDAPSGSDEKEGAASPILRKLEPASVEVCVLMAKERKEFDVVADILRVAALGSKESEIIVGCDLDRNSLEKYLPVMMLLKLVSVKKESENFYRTTSKGLEFLRFYHGLRWLLWGKEFDYVLVKIMNKLKKEEKPYYVR